MDSQGKAAIANLKLRVLSGVVLCPLAILAVYFGGLFFLAMVTAAAVLAVAEWTKLAGAAADFLAGILYLAVCFSAFTYLRFSYGPMFALAPMIAVWASDTGAYIIGKKFGKHKMAPKISPNKTIEGLAGAIVSCGMALAAMAAAFDLFPVWCAFIAGCFLGLAGQGGDLLKSIYKRRAGVKDSGHLIPGHGGVLDRIDSLLPVAPLFLLMVILWME